MIFTETEAQGGFIIDLERREDTAASSRAPSARTSSRPRPEAVSRRRTSPSTSARGRCAACTSSSRRPPRRSSCAAPAGRSSTSSSICDRRARRISSMSRSSSRRQPSRALRPRALRARLPGARGQHRDELPGRRVLHARGRGRPSPRRSAPRAEWPLPVTEISEKDAALAAPRRGRAGDQAPDDDRARSRRE